MFGASVFVLHLRHFFFSAVQHAAELVRQTKVDTRADAEDAKSRSSRSRGRNRQHARRMRSPEISATRCGNPSSRLSVQAMSAEIKPSVRNALGVLRNGPFRRYIIGSAISDTGTWMQVMAQGWVMATLTSSALMLGLVNLCAGLPMLLLTMVGGAAADRFDKRKILLITQYVQIALAVGIGLLVMSGKIAIWQIFVFAAILGISNSFEMPTLSALVPELVGREQIQNAISLDRSVFHGSRVFGPAIGGFLIKAFGTASAFFANAISFVALIIAILSLPPRVKGTAEEEEKRTSGIKDGFRYVANDK